MSLKIHAFPLSPRGFKVLCFANHIGADYEFVLCDLRKGAQRTPEFTALNLNQRMPVLEEDGWSLWESNAILQYLAANAGLLPKDERARADIARWMFWESAHWDQACAILVFERFVKGAFGLGAADEKEVEKGIAQFHRAGSVLDRHLEGRRYLCNDTLSIADFAVGAALIMSDMAQFPLGDYAQIKRWHAQLTALPAWPKTLAMGSALASAA